MIAGERDGHGRYGFLDELDGRLVCHECGKRLKSLPRHLAVAHEMTSDEYRARHGLARTLALVSSQTRDRLSDAGVRRRDTDPRVMATLDGPGADRQRAQRFPTRPLRPSTTAAGRSAKQAAGAQHLAQRLAEHGWSSLEEAVSWTQEQGGGWTTLARHLGMSHTPLQRRGEALGLHLQPRAPAQDKLHAALQQARDHAHANGSLTGARGDLAKWLTKRRWIANHRERQPSPTTRALDAIDPRWLEPRRQKRSP